MFGYAQFIQFYIKTKIQFKYINLKQGMLKNSFTRRDKIYINIVIKVLVKIFYTVFYR